MARNSGGRAMGASSLTSASLIRWAGFLAALAARSSADAPCVMNAIMSRGNAGSAAARSTIASSTTTPMRVTPPCEEAAGLLLLLKLRLLAKTVFELLSAAHQPPHRRGVESPGGVVFLEL